MEARRNDALFIVARHAAHQDNPRFSSLLAGVQFITRGYLEISAADVQEGEYRCNPEGIFAFERYNGLHGARLQRDRDSASHCIYTFHSNITKT